jgi:Ketopantoate reductase PanE/ApbA C terminal
MVMTNTSPQTLLELLEPGPGSQTAIALPDENVKVNYDSLRGQIHAVADAFASAGRPLELEAIAGAAVELGEKLGMPMTATRAVHACTKLLDERRRAPREAPRVEEAVR